jgi:lipoate-protein ligase B
MKKLDVIDLGAFSYEEAYFLQKKIVSEKKLNRHNDSVILVEHPNIFTIGRSGSRDNILVDDDFLSENKLKTINVDRGGDVTFHGIGQLVAYPIFDLRNHAKDVHKFIKNLENVLKLTVSEYDLTADSENKYTGLWVDGKKIGFIGIGVSNWITYHGICLNANVDLKYFSTIKPCGIENLEVSSLKEILNKDIDINSLKDTVVEKICEVFGFEHSHRSPRDAFVAKEAAA